MYVQTSSEWRGSGKIPTMDPESTSLITWFGSKWYLSETVVTFDSDPLSSIP